MAKPQKKTRYTPETKHAVISLYPLCQEVEDKEELAQRLNIGSLHKLYNLASRLGVTREYHDCYGPNGEWLIAGAYVPRQDAKAWHERQDFATTKFTAKDDSYIRRYFGRQHIEEIRFVRKHTETAIMYRARKLGLRKAVHYWDLRRVLAWLDLNRMEFESLGKNVGLTIHACADLTGDIKIRLVSTQDLARLLLHKQLWKSLLGRGEGEIFKNRRADEFFIREILESKILLDEDANHQQQLLPVKTLEYKKTYPERTRLFDADAKRVQKKADEVFATLNLDNYPNLKESVTELYKKSKKKKKLSEKDLVKIQDLFIAELQKQVHDQIELKFKKDYPERTYLDAKDQEKVQVLVNHERLVEPCVWVSHGRTNLNPLDPECFEWFYDGEINKAQSDQKQMGKRYMPKDLHPRTIFTLC